MSELMMGGNLDPDGAGSVYGGATAEAAVQATMV